MSSSKREQRKLQVQAHTPQQSGMGPGTAFAAKVEMTQTRSGPLPDPVDMEQYERICPGSAQKIVDQFVLQSEHRRTLELAVISGNEHRANLGQWFAFVLGILGIGGGIVLAYNGKQTAGLVSVVTALGSLLAVFLVGRSKQGKEREEKRPLPRKQ